MNELDELKKIYFQECDELLVELERHLLALDDGRDDADTLNAAFRAIHSIKGGAGAFGFRRLVDLSHGFEALLDKLRGGAVALDRNVIKLLLRAADAAADQVAAAKSGVDLAADRGHDVMTALRPYADPLSVPRPLAVAPPRSPSALPTRQFRIEFSPPPDLFRRANEPQFLIRELGALGVLTVTADESAVPALTDLAAEDCYLRWTCELETAAGVDEIRDVFEFAAEDGDLRILALDGDQWIDVAPAPTPAQTDIATGDNNGVPGGNGPTKRTPDQGDDTMLVASAIRVDLDRMDKLVNLVGELVVSQAMISEQLTLIPPETFPVLTRNIEELSRHARNLQEGIMAMRAQPVRSVFGRMPRLVRELCDATGKRARLVVAGEETEIDKTVIDQLFDPLIHMIRNAIDHGIEMPADRIAAGKPAEAAIRLSAGHVGGRIVIEIADDGRGIDRARVRDRAIERGFIAPDAALDDDQVDNLIFVPGLSTAREVSDISGRGVGMDVVQRNAQRLGGRIVVRSTPGAGSAFVMTLPLTLAVLDGMLVRVGSETYVVPLTGIVESLRPNAVDIRPLTGDRDVLSVRGAYYPLVYLGRLFGVAGARDDPTKGLVMLVDSDVGGTFGLVVDEIVGQQQVVIKSLESNYRGEIGIAGATILGDGRVALILDLPGLVETVRGRARPHVPQALANNSEELRA